MLALILFQVVEWAAVFAWTQNPWALAAMICGVGTLVWCNVFLREPSWRDDDDTQHPDTAMLKELQTTRDVVILALGRFAEFRDLETGRHLARISRYVELLARKLRDADPAAHAHLTDDWIHDLGLAASLHDIGKVGIPDQILHKPGQLTAEERALIEDHSVIGGECLHEMEAQLGSSRLLSLAREIAYSHHEWWNGRGYPFKLEGPAIPLSARIVALADVYDALTTSRTYKSAAPHEQARTIIINGKGSQFDPALVDAFVACEARFKQVAVELSHNDLEKYENPPEAEPSASTPSASHSATPDPVEISQCPSQQPD